MLYVKMGTQVTFDDGNGSRQWTAEEVALSRYLDLQGPTVFNSEMAPMKRVFAEASEDGSLVMRAVATVQGETSDGGGVGAVGVPGALLGTAKVSPDSLYDA